MRFSESARSISSSKEVRIKGVRGKESSWEKHIGNADNSDRDFLLSGVWGSGGFRRVRSCVRSRKLLTRASGTRLASRLRRNKFWEKCASRADLDFWDSRW